MKTRRILKMLLAGMICVAMSSCSFFASGKQVVRIETNRPDSIIKVDGNVVGTAGSAVVELSGTKTHVVVAQRDHVIKNAVLDSGLSVTGLLDLAGGCICLVPLIGLCSEGAWQLYPDSVTFDME